MTDMLLDRLSDPNIRRELLLKFQGKQEGGDEEHEGWQDQSTPMWVVHDMVELIPTPATYLWVVLFNHEFLEELLYTRGVPADRVMFLADCEGEGYLSMAVYRVKTFVLPEDCRDPKRAMELLKDKIEKAFYQGGDMPKTNNLVVIGNPPYQEQSEKQKARTGGKAQAKSIYHLFVEAVIDTLEPRILSFITPSRWMAGGMGLDKYRKRMMQDKRLKVIQHFPREHEVFPEVSIKGGVSYFLWDREYSGKCLFNGVHRSLNEYDIVPLDNEATSILDKILAASDAAYLNARCLPQKPFGIPTKFEGWKPFGVRCIARGMEECFVDPLEYTDKNCAINKWKVCTAKAGNVKENKQGKVRYIDNVFILEPGSICSETYIVLSAFGKEKEAQNFALYVKTKFFRFMLGLRMVTQDVNKEKLAWVPDLVDYSTAPTDRSLCERYNLTQKEIGHINERVA
jgi:site-specific DNA-methyltransferase (adenine-specific)